MKLPQVFLRDLFWLVALAAVGCGWWVRERQLAQERKSLAAERDSLLAEKQVLLKEVEVALKFLDQALPPRINAP